MHASLPSIEAILKASPDRGAPLLVHGILHLLGHDHVKKADLVKMEKKEEEILEKLEKK